MAHNSRGKLWLQAWLKIAIIYKKRKAMRVHRLSLGVHHTLATLFLKNFVKTYPTHRKEKRVSWSLTGVAKSTIQTHLPFLLLPSPYFKSYLKSVAISSRLPCQNIHIDLEEVLNTIVKKKIIPTVMKDVAKKATLLLKVLHNKPVIALAKKLQILWPEV